MNSFNRIWICNVYDYTSIVFQNNGAGVYEHKCHWICLKITVFWKLRSDSTRYGWTMWLFNRVVKWGGPQFDCIFFLCMLRNYSDLCQPISIIFFGGKVIRKIMKSVVITLVHFLLLMRTCLLHVNSINDYHKTSSK